MKKFPLYVFLSGFFTIGMFFSYKVVSEEFTGRPIDGQSVTIGALDKISGRVQELDIRVGEVGKFYSLDIHVMKCQLNPPEKRPENSVFFKIFEDNEEKGLSKKIFQGWMFSSSPALSAIDHPVYDVWVIRCIKD